MHLFLSLKYFKIDADFNYRVSLSHTHTHAYTQFLTHNIRAHKHTCLQVRCMAAVLLLVGQGLEEPDIVARMLDLSTFPCKPQYAMAPEVGVAVAPA